MLNNDRVRIIAIDTNDHIYLLQNWAQYLDYHVKMTLDGDVLESTFDPAGDDDPSQIDDDVLLRDLVPPEMKEDLFLPGEPRTSFPFLAEKKYQSPDLILRPDEVVDHLHPISEQGSKDILEYISRFTDGQINLLGRYSDILTAEVRLSENEWMVCRYISLIHRADKPHTTHDKDGNKIESYNRYASAGLLQYVRQEGDNYHTESYFPDDGRTILSHPCQIVVTNDKMVVLDCPYSRENNKIFIFRRKQGT